MKRLLWAAILALPGLLLTTTSASAQCWSCGPCAYPTCNTCGPLHCHPVVKTVWPWSAVLGPSCCGQCGYAPGPWYTFWPSCPGGPQSSAFTYPNWAYDCHFQTSAPLFFAAAPAAPSFFGGYNAYGYAASGYFGP